MRAYFFTNMYLSSIQQGIQPLHCIVEMMATAWPNHIRDILYDWAFNHKTVICLNGGATGNVCEIYDRVKLLGKRLDLPFGSFNEDEYSLSGIKTTCGIIVPSVIYELAQDLRSNRWLTKDGDRSIMEAYSSDEIALAKLLNECSLAH